MECDEKEFGCLCKNVGGHFPCLFHGLNVMSIDTTRFFEMYIFCNSDFLIHINNGGIGMSWKYVD